MKVWLSFVRMRHVAAAASLRCSPASSISPIRSIKDASPAARLPATHCGSDNDNDSEDGSGGIEAGADDSEPS